MTGQERTTGEKPPGLEEDVESEPKTQEEKRPSQVESEQKVCEEQREAHEAGEEKRRAQEVHEEESAEGA